MTHARSVGGERTPARIVAALLIATTIAIGAQLSAQSPPPPPPAQPRLVTGPNTNIAGGPAALTLDPYFVRGDLLRKAQNEPSCTISTRNPKNIICGANDYRMVDVPGVSVTSEVRDAWQGVFQSADGGETWESTLHPGFFLDPAPHILSAQGFRAAADPTLRGGPGGMAFYSGIAFSGPDRDEGAVFVSTFIDLNNKENDRMPFKFVRTTLVDRGNSGQFTDKPWMFVEATNPTTCTFQVPLEDGTTVPQTVPGSTIHLLYSIFVGNMEQVIRTKLMYAQSTDCGATFTKPVKVSESVAINQGATIAKFLTTGSKTVFGAWRRFPTGQVGNAIVSIVSPDNGATWTKAAVVAEACPWDQVTSKTTFRATAFPTMTASAGRVYVAWADRRNPVTGACQVDGFGNPIGTSRILISSSIDGSAWTTPQEAVPSATDEHQIWPSLAFTAGKVFLAWVDFKEDAAGVFAPQVNERDVLLNPPPIRHTGDVRLAMADPATMPDFAADVSKVSKYLQGVATFKGAKVVGQIQWNAVNKRWAKRGAVPFDGDYIDIATMPYVPPDPKAGRPGWTPNNGQVALAPTVLVAWTDNRDMRRVPGVDNADVPVPYATPAGLNLPLASFFDPTQSRPVCMPGQEFATGTMNQNVYAARATRGFVASSPGNNKTLGTIQRAFVVVVRNDTDALSQFQLLAAQPAGGFATFDQFDPTKTSITLLVPRHSSVARTVFVSPDPASATPLDPDAVVPVTVTEVVGGTPVQTTTVFLNSDPSAPEIDGPEIDGSEVFAPEIDGPEIDGHGFHAPEIDGPEIDGPEIDGQEILSLGVQTPEIDGPEIDGPEIDGPEIDGPEIDGSSIDESAITDITYHVTNKGNTTGHFKAKALVDKNKGFNYQIIVRRRYKIPTVDQTCLPTTVNISKVAVSLLNVNLPSPEIDGPEIDGSSLDTASFAIAPLETVDFVIRVRGGFDGIPVPDQNPDPAQNELAEVAELAIQPEPVSTPDLEEGITEPPTVTTFLTISTTALPTGIVGAPYSRALQASGGEGTLTWTLLPGGGLPPGLTLSMAGLISGAPSEAGTFTFTVQVQDSAAPPKTASKELTIVVVPAATQSLAFVTQPSDTLFGQIISPAPSVKAFDSTGAALPGLQVTLALGANPGGGTLSGTLTVTTDASGVAVFPNLSINNAGNGYTLVASAAAIASATSKMFDIVAPDLVVDSLTHSPANPNTSQTITFTAVVRNAGTAEAGPSTLMFTIGGETPGAPETLFAVPALVPGATFTVERQQVLSVAQVYTNTATADFTSQVVESNEGNNTATDTYTVVLPADLVIDTMTHSPANPTTADTITFTAVVKNIGTGTAGASTLMFKIGGETSGAAQTLFPIPELLSGASYEVKREMKLTVAQNYLNTATADYNDEIAETNEANNTSTHAYTVINGPTTFTVGNTNDSGAGSFRQALQDSNDNAGYTDTIVFTIPGPAPHTITPLSPLPGIEDTVLIDAPPTGDCSGAAPTIEIDGVSAGLAHGLVVNTGGVIIRGLSITRFAFSGIFLAGGGSNVVECSYLGVAPDGVTAKGNGDGIRISGSVDNTIGGTSAAVRNVISGNHGEEGVGFGINILPSSGGTKVLGNFIGTNAAGTAALGNSDDGVRVATPNTVIGGLTATPGTGPGNVISGNAGDGVQICGFLLSGACSSGAGGAAGTVIQGNIIGLRADGSTAIGNSSAGIRTSNAGVQVGGTAAGARNVVSANLISGVLLSNSGSTFNTFIQGNYIGTDITGMLDRGNGTGVNVGSAPGTRVGGSEPGAGNVISGNSTGVFISSISHPVIDINADSIGDYNALVQGNLIGLNAAGTAALGNTTGVTMSNANNLVGGTTVAARNIISGNTGSGVHITAAAATGNVVQGNYVGTDVSGALDLGNSGNGVHVIDAASNTIGGVTASARNVISGNNGEGVRVDGAGATGNVIQGNSIGRNATHTGPLGNSASGVFIRRAPGNSVIDNTIMNNLGFAGVAICGNVGGFCGGSDAGTQTSNGDGNAVRGNFINDNAGRGVSLDGVASTLVGTDNGNNISGNGVNGIMVFGAGATGNQIASNAINSNTGDGVHIVGLGNTGNRVQGNSFINNTDLAIDLGGDGVTANDAGDGDAGPNGLQNFPVLDSATSVSGTTTVSGTLNSTPNTTFTIDVFANSACDASGNGEGADHLGSTTVTTSVDGYAPFEVVFNVGLVATDQVTATATAPNGNTSEFSACQGVGFSPATHMGFITQPSNTTAGSQISPPVRVAALDASGNIDPTVDFWVELFIQNNPGGGTLSGSITQHAVDGIATFPDLSINNAGGGYTLRAVSYHFDPDIPDKPNPPVFPDVISAAFDITSP